MKNITNIVPSLLGTPSSLRSPLLLLIAGILLPLSSSPSSAFAGSATWLASPPTGNWNHAANWTPATIPNGRADTATFQSSKITAISLLDNIEVDGLVFEPGASAFSIMANAFSSPVRVAFEMSGVGITNNSGIIQNFVNSGNYSTLFLNNASAGSLTLFTTEANGSVSFLGTSTADNGAFINLGNDRLGAQGSTSFFNNSTAGNATITNRGGFGGKGRGGLLRFFDRASAGNSNVTNESGTANLASANPASGGTTIFYVRSTAGSAVFTNLGATEEGASGGLTIFDFDSSAGNSRLIAYGGSGRGAGGGIQFKSRSTGGTARVEVFGNGNLDISDISVGGVAIGSIEGDGDVFLGLSNLRIGSNNRSVKFSGVIQDGGVVGGTGGSLTKIGTGKLVLNHLNTYTGGTRVKKGKLVVNNQGESGTGPGPVQVEDGKLGGKGMIAGAVTIGTGSGAGAVLAPGYLHGVGRPGALTIQSPLTFNSDGTYQMELNSSNVTADEVIANGVTINAGAQFSFLDFGSASLPPGTVFTAINNTAANPIAGAFVNLPAGSTFTSNGNTYRVNYKGGDGNDLTLTVVW